MLKLKPEIQNKEKLEVKKEYNVPEYIREEFRFVYDEYGMIGLSSVGIAFYNFSRSLKHLNTLDDIQENNDVEATDKKDTYHDPREKHIRGFINEDGSTHTEFTKEEIQASTEYNQNLYKKRIKELMDEFDIGKGVATYVAVTFRLLQTYQSYVPTVWHRSIYEEMVNTIITRKRGKPEFSEDHTRVKLDEVLSFDLKKAQSNYTYKPFTFLENPNWNYQDGIIFESVKDREDKQSIYEERHLSTLAQNFNR